MILLLPLICSPLVWMSQFDARDAVAASLTLVLLAMAYKGRKFHCPLAPNEQVNDCGDRLWANVTGALAASLLIQLYLPLLDFFQVPPGTLFLISIILVVTHALAGRISRPWSSEGIEKSGAVIFFLMIPILIGFTVIMGFQLSDREIPGIFYPLAGGQNLIAITLLWWVAWRRNPFSGAERENQRATHQRLFLQLSTFMIAVILAFLIVRIWGIESTSRKNQKELPNVVESWDSLLRSAEQLNFPMLDSHVRVKALSSQAAQANPSVRVRWLKQSGEDLTDEVPSPGLYWEFLARGGKIFKNFGNATAVGIAHDRKGEIIWVLTRSGKLVRLSNELEILSATPRSERFVHLRLDSDGNPLLLENSGRLLKYEKGEFIEYCPGQPPPHPATFTRLEIDPVSGDPWALDLYGRLYHTPTRSGWSESKVFVPLSSHQGQPYDIARDIAISREGRIAFLNCFGEVTTAPLDAALAGRGGSLENPHREAHYWPGSAVGQSIGANFHGFDIIDRYGGLYRTPLPDPVNWPQGNRQQTDFRSLPRKNQDVVDHFLMPEEGWAYMLTKSGRVLTNKGWMGRWAR